MVKTQNGVRTTMMAYMGSFVFHITAQQLEMLASLMDEKKCGTVEIY
jgi:hypothetical protein